MVFFIIWLCSFLDFVVGAEKGLQSVGETTIARSTVLQRILLVGTLDGTLYAFDKYTGVLLWENKQLGGPLMTRSSNDNDSLGPSYFVEPLNQGSIYAYIPNSGLKVLEIFVMASFLYLETSIDGNVVGVANAPQLA